MTQYDLITPEGSFSVKAERFEGGYRVNVNGKTLNIRLEKNEDSDSLVVQVGGRPLTISLVSLTGQQVGFVLEGEHLSYRKQLTGLNPTPAVKDVSSARGEVLSSPMPGRVITVMMKAGDIAKIGDPLMVLESMKMETVIRSDRDAKVEEILVYEGSAVKRGQPLVSFAAKALS